MRCSHAKEVQNMKCPKCSGKIQVTDTVHTADNEIYRKRKCLSCGRFFYTTEFEVEVTAEFLEEWYKAYRRTQANWKKIGPKQYTIYLAKDDSIVASGTAKECANQMGVSHDVFRSIVSRAKNKKRKKYEVYISTGDEDDADCYCE